MSSSATSNKNSSEETTKVEQPQEMESSSKGGRKLTPLPLNTASTKPGQSQAAVHKLSTTLEEEDELEIDSNENRNEPVQSHLPKNSNSSFSAVNSTGSAPNTKENGNT